MAATRPTASQFGADELWSGYTADHDDPCIVARFGTRVVLAVYYGEGVVGVDEDTYADVAAAQADMKLLADSVHLWILDADTCTDEHGIDPGWPADFTVA